MSQFFLGSRFSLSLCLFLALSVGCRSNGPVNGDVARKSLETALTTWKAGEPPTSLEQKSPRIIAGDFDWQAGQKLVDFKIQEQDGREGNNLRKSVELTLQSGSGKPVRVVAEYLITTHPVITVVRQETE